MPPKSTKSKKEEIIEELLEEDIYEETDEEMDMDMDMEEEEDMEEEVEEVEEKPSKKKSKPTKTPVSETHTKAPSNGPEIMSMLDNINKQMTLLEEEYKEKHDAFKKYESEYNKQKKALIQKQESNLKRITKYIKAPSKPRAPGTVGGFNKPTPVPKVLCKYLELESDVLKSRPEVIQLLREKFDKEGYVDSKTKEIKLPNKLLSKFGHKNNYVFKGNRYTSFVKPIYDSEKEST